MQSRSTAGTEACRLLMGLAGLCMAAALAGCGGGGGGSSGGSTNTGGGTTTNTTPAPEVNTVAVSPMQVVLDAAQPAADSIPSVTSNADTGVSAQEIVVIQTAFDKIADGLL